MLALSGLDPNDTDEYQRRFRDNELAYPLWASLRILVTKKATEHTADTLAEPSQVAQGTQLRFIVVEAAEQDLAMRPTRALSDLNALLLNLMNQTDRLVPCKVDDLRASPFYNIEISPNDEAVDKALVLIRATQKSVGKNIANAFRVVTDNLTDPFLTNVAEQHACIRAVGLCNFENADDFKIAKTNTTAGSLALAIIGKVSQGTPTDGQKSSYDIYIDKVQQIEESQWENVKRLMLAMIKLTTKVTWSEEYMRTPWNKRSPETPWTMKKCRKLSACPTDRSVEPS